MAHELNISLDPVTQPSLTVSAQLLLAGTIAATVTLTESAAAFYTNATALPTLAAGNYGVRFVTAAGIVGTGILYWNGTAEVPPSVTTVNPTIVRQVVVAP